MIFHLRFADCCNFPITKFSTLNSPHNPDRHYPFGHPCAGFLREYLLSFMSMYVAGLCCYVFVMWLPLLTFRLTVMKSSPLFGHREHHLYRSLQLLAVLCNACYRDFCSLCQIGLLASHVYINAAVVGMPWCERGTRKPSCFCLAALS